jgi:hypothetical protein
MRLLASTAVALTAAACAAAPPPGEPTAGPVVASVEPLVLEPEPAWEPLARIPAARGNSAVERMTLADLRAWIDPESTAHFVDAAFNRGRFPHVNAVTFSAQPQPSGRPGLCVIEQHVYLMRTPDERNLTPQQQLDLPRQPYQKMTQRLYRAGASTLKPYDASTAQGACWDHPPLEPYFKAPGPEAAWRAVNLMEQAQAAMRGPAAPQFRFTCTEFTPAPAEGLSNDPRPCPDPRARIAALAPHHLRFVKVIPCEGTLAGPGVCYEYDYRDPEATETYRYWGVKIRGGERPVRVELAQGMYPPH